jgi:hypothetical protein
MSGFSPREQREIVQANQSGMEPVVFVHGLWLLASSWDPWRKFFEDSGYVTLAPSWPDDPETVEEARQHPEVFAHKREVAEVALAFVKQHDRRIPPRRGRGASRRAGTRSPDRSHGHEHHHDP